MYVSELHSLKMLPFSSVFCFSDSWCTETEKLRRLPLEGSQSFQRFGFSGSKRGTKDWHYNMIEELMNIRETTLTTFLDRNEANYMLNDICISH